MMKCCFWCQPVLSLKLKSIAKIWSSKRLSVKLLAKSYGTLQIIAKFIAKIIAKIIAKSIAKFNAKFIAKLSLSLNYRYIIAKLSLNI